MHEVGFQKEACFRLLLPDSFLSIALELSLIFIGMSIHAQPSIPFRLAVKGKPTGGADSWGYYILPWQGQALCVACDYPFRNSLTLGLGDKTFPVSSALIILIYLSASNRTAIKIT